jgi:hypothetical protein
VVLLGIGIRETLTGSWVGGVLAWILAALAALQIRSLDKR